MKGNGKSSKDTKFSNPCYLNGCHHNRDKKAKPFKITGKNNKEN